MSYRRIDYLEWARTYMGRVRNDLARSNVKAVTKEELGLTLDDVDIGGADEQGHPALTSVLSKKYGVPAERIHVVNGATAGITLACAATIRDGDEVLVETPNYEPVYRSAVLHGGSIRMLERTFDRSWQLSLEELERKITKHTRAILLTNAHNPSGTLTSPEKMLTIGQIARDHGAKVIVSENYLDNLFKGKPISCATQGDAFVAIASVSKCLGLGSLRVGWVVASEEVIGKIRIAADYLAGGISSPSQTIAAKALAQGDRLIERGRKIVQGNLKIVADWIRKRGDIQWVEPDAGTVALLKLPTGIDAMALSNLLREKYSTLVVPGDFFWLKGFVRVSCGIDEEIVRTGLKNLGAAIDQMKAGGR